jgi:hypothetical protein
MSNVLPLHRTRSFRRAAGHPDLEEPHVGPSPRVENLIRSIIDEFIFARSPQLEM